MSSAPSAQPGELCRFHRDLYRQNRAKVEGRRATGRGGACAGRVATSSARSVAGCSSCSGWRAGTSAAAAARLAAKVARLRVFEDDEGRFDRSLVDVGGAALVVSQFTLLADTAKGNRPSFCEAAPPEEAEPLYEAFCEALRGAGVPVETGVFGARMRVELVNDGPVTILLEL